MHTQATTWDRLAGHVQGYFRARRARLLLERFPNLAGLRICDLGGSRHFWESAGLDVPPSHITIYNVGAGDAGARTRGRYSRIPIKTYDGVHVPERTKRFDLVICNSVIEHVPLRKRRALVREMARIGTHVYLQTPAKSFVVDPHFVMPLIHWLPQRARLVLARVSPWRILSRPSRATLRSYVLGTNLLSQTQLKRLTPNAKIYRERVLGLTKSYVAIV